MWISRRRYDELIQAAALVEHWMQLAKSAQASVARLQDEMREDREHTQAAMAAVLAERDRALAAPAGPPAVDQWIGWDDDPEVLAEWQKKQREAKDPLAGLLSVLEEGGPRE